MPIIPKDTVTKWGVSIATDYEPTCGEPFKGTWHPWYGDLGLLFWPKRLHSDDLGTCVMTIYPWGTAYDSYSEYKEAQ